MELCSLHRKVQDKQINTLRKYQEITVIETPSSPSKDTDVNTVYLRKGQKVWFSLGLSGNSALAFFRLPYVDFVP